MDVVANQAEYLDGQVMSAAIGNMVSLLDAGGNEVGSYTTIQEAVDAALDGYTVLVGPGTYAENVVIATSGITLLSAEGRGTTIIDGVQGGGELGAIVLAGGVNNVTIGAAGQGFTINGLNGNGAIEKAAVYLQGTHAGIDIVDNELVARGDLALLSEFNQAITDIRVDGNTFSGQTFEGTQPQDSGSANGAQFVVGNNIARQLVALGGGTLGAGNPSNGVEFVNKPQIH